MESPTIWRQEPSLAELNRLNEGTMGGAIGLEFVEIGADFLRLRMPVDQRTVQPFGLLHGGASAALAETVGSVASNLVIDSSRQAAVGIELNCSHLRGASAGHVIGTCKPLRLGRTLHVWSIDIHDEQQRLVCTARLSVAIVATAAA